MDSSDWSSQSGWLSQTHSSGMHTLLLHWNSLGLQVRGEHFLSSLPSPQSLSPSHTKMMEIHDLLLHWNSLGEQAWEEKQTGELWGLPPTTPHHCASFSTLRMSETGAGRGAQKHYLGCPNRKHFSPIVNYLARSRWRHSSHLHGCAIGRTLYRLWAALKRKGQQGCENCR